MSPKITLILASIAFAVLWTAYMIWQTSTGTANTVILMHLPARSPARCWYFGMRMVTNKCIARQ